MAKVVRVNEPRKLTRTAGNAWTVRVDPIRCPSCGGEPNKLGDQVSDDVKKALGVSPSEIGKCHSCGGKMTGVDLTGTVLHQWATGDIPSLRLGDDYYFELWDIPPDSFIKRMLVDENGTPAGEFVINLPDTLVALDACIADIGSNRLTDRAIRARRATLVNHIGGIIDGHVVHFRTKYPGVMAYILAAPRDMPLNCVGITLDTAYHLTRGIIRDAKTNPISKDVLDKMLMRLSVSKPLHVLSVKIMLGAAVPIDPEKDKKTVAELAKMLDGMKCYCLRYPNASSTSNSPATLRVMIGAPCSGVYIPIERLKYYYQGDCDGDLGDIVVLPRENSKSSPLEYHRDYSIGECPIELEHLEAPEAKDPMVLMEGMSERGRYIGMLTYSAIWMMGYAAALNYKDLHYEELDGTLSKFKNPKDVWDHVLDLSTPLVEGVMNKRKVGQTEESIANAFCEMCMGWRDISSVLNSLGVKEEGDRDEEKHTRRQIRLLGNILYTVSRGKERVRLTNIETGVGQDPALYAFSLRFRQGPGKPVDHLLREYGKGADVYGIAMRSFLCKEFRHWKVKPVRQPPAETIDEFYVE